MYLRLIMPNLIGRQDRSGLMKEVDVTQREG